MIFYYFQRSISQAIRLFKITNQICFLKKNHKNVLNFYLCLFLYTVINDNKMFKFYPKGAMLEKYKTIYINQVTPLFELGYMRILKI